MSVGRIFSLVVALLAVLQVSLGSYALTREVQMLVNYETQANAVAARSPQKVNIEHFEIPLRIVESEFAQRVAPEIRNALIFQKNGEAYVRWVINPEDTEWWPKVEEFLTKEKIPVVRGFYFHGYQTASRSYIIEDPNSNVQFSIKSSTNRTGGNWTNKKQTFNDGVDIRATADVLARLQAIKPFEHVVLMDEPAVLGLKEIDQGLVIRTLNELPKGKFHYVPGFSVLHEQAGREIAKINGSDDPLKFWTENYIAPTARALAEFAARTGMTFDSPHSQNFLVELDAQMKPTGRIVFRDLGDIYVNRPVLEALGEREYLRKFTEPDNIIDRQMGFFGPLHGNTSPTWITSADYDGWAEVYKNHFEKEYAKQTGMAIEAFTQPVKRTGMYFGMTYSVNSPAFKEYMQRLGAAYSRTPAANQCQAIF